MTELLSYPLMWGSLVAPCKKLPPFLLAPKECPPRLCPSPSLWPQGRRGDNFRSDNGGPRKHLAPVPNKPRTQSVLCFYYTVYTMIMLALDHQKCTATQWGQKGQGLPDRWGRLEAIQGSWFTEGIRDGVAIFWPWRAHSHFQPHCFQLAVLLPLRSMCSLPPLLLLHNPVIDLSFPPSPHIHPVSSMLHHLCLGT